MNTFSWLQHLDSKEIITLFGPGGNLGISSSTYRCSQRNTANSLCLCWEGLGTCRYKEDNTLKGQVRTRVYEDLAVINTAANWPVRGKAYFISTSAEEGSDECLHQPAGCLVRSDLAWRKL